MTSGNIHPNGENSCAIVCAGCERSLRRAMRAVWHPPMAIAPLSTLLVVVVVMVSTVRPAPAQTLTVIHGFGSGTDGANSRAAVIRDSLGNLYGTTGGGGTSGCGTVFSVSPSGVEKILYSFTCGADGQSPYASLILDAAGNLYGTTYSGGAYGGGTVFRVTKTGLETVLHSFGAGSDGYYPLGGLYRDSAGNLYGTTGSGGSNGFGTVFQITASGTESVLHSFGWADGASPWNSLVQDTAGNLYGTASVGGAYGYGVVFKMSLTGTVTLLYSFTGGADGKNPYCSLVRDLAGNLYGTTYAGGAYGYGTIFEVPNSGAYRVLHSFTLSGADGGNPFAGLVQGANMTLYGTAWYGGKYGFGIIFQIIPASATYNPIYGFKAQADGAGLMGGLILDPSGALYGTTEWYGTYGEGALFKLVL